MDVDDLEKWFRSSRAEKATGGDLEWYRAGSQEPRQADAIRLQMCWNVGALRDLKEAR